VHLQTNDPRVRFPAQPPISLQLFTLRREADADLRSVLRWIAEVGFVGVELPGLHHAEFANRFDGRSAYEILVEQLDERVMLELDIYWAAVGGADPATVLRGLGGRARFVHVKDGPLDPAEPMTAVGAGRVDVVDALTASDAVAWHIVEIDRVEGDMRAAVVDSYRYLVEAGLSRGRQAHGKTRRNHSVR